MTYFYGPISTIVSGVESAGSYFTPDNGDRRLSRVFTAWAWCRVSA